jgi:hypothetical protein
VIRSIRGMAPSRGAFPGPLEDAMPPRTLALFVLSALIAGACAAAGPVLPEPAAPASEPRATLRLALDLRRGQRCAEAFDLAMYQDRGIELIAWDEGSRCEDRAITVRYLPRRTSPEAILAAAAKAGARITRSEQLQGEKR